MNTNRTAGLWCKTCRYHTCRCIAPTQWLQMAEAVAKLAWECGANTGYRRTLTLDDMRCNAVESLIEELQERD